MSSFEGWTTVCWATTIHSFYVPQPNFICEFCSVNSELIKCFFFFSCASYFYQFMGHELLKSKGRVLAEIFIHIIKLRKVCVFSHQFFRLKINGYSDLSWSFVLWGGEKKVKTLKKKKKRGNVMLHLKTVSGSEFLALKQLKGISYISTDRDWRYSSFAWHTQGP